MPVHVEEMVSEVSVAQGDLPLSDAQLNKLVDIVLQRLQQRQRDERARKEGSVIRNQATPDRGHHGG